MAMFSKGDEVYVPCRAHPGPFPDERLIGIELEDGNVLSGFVDVEFLEEPNAETTFVQGTVMKVSENSVWIRVSGSFFQTAMGKTEVSPDWAATHLRQVAA